MKILSLIGRILLFSSILLLANCGNPSISGSTMTPQPQPTPSPTQGVAVPSIGTPYVASAIWTVTVHSARTSLGNTYTVPSAGHIFLVFDVTLKNTSSTVQQVSSLVMFSLKDSTGQQYTQTFLSGITPPDGTDTAGGLLRGQIVYEVPTSERTFTLGFHPGFSGMVIEWQISI